MSRISKVVVVPVITHKQTTQDIRSILFEVGSHYLYASGGSLDPFPQHSPIPPRNDVVREGRLSLTTSQSALYHNMEAREGVAFRQSRVRLDMPMFTVRPGQFRVGVASVVHRLSPKANGEASVNVLAQAHTSGNDFCNTHSHRGL